MENKKRQSLVEERLIKLGRVMRAKEEDSLGLVEIEDSLTSVDMYIYRKIMLEADRVEFKYIKRRYWGEEEVTHKEVMEELGISRPKYFDVRKGLLEGIYKGLVDEGYIKEGI